MLLACAGCPVSTEAMERTRPLPVTRLPHFAGLELPRYATAGAAGLDLVAALEDALELAPGERALVPTGLAFAVPEGFEVQIRPRSGLALKQGITCLNTPGTIDSDYRGEVRVILANLGREPVTIERGMRIAQMVLCPVYQVAWEPVAALDETARGAGGFGSTGTHG